MSLELKITRVMDEGPWEDMNTYSLDLETVDGSQRFSNAARYVKVKDGQHKEPQEGEVIWADLLPTKDPNRQKVRLDYEAMKSGGGSRPSGGSTETKTSNTAKGDVDWDRKNGEIRRQHSQEMSIRTVTTWQNPPSSDEQIEAVLTRWADWFDQDAITAGLKASSQTESSATATEVDFSGARTSEPGQVQSQGAVPASSSPQVSPPSGAAPGSVPVDDTHQWIESLLVVAGGGWGSTALAKYAVTKLKPEQRLQLESELNDPETDRKLAGLKRIEASYVKAEGQPVPTGDDDSDLPF